MLVEEVTAHGDDGDESAGRREPPRRLFRFRGDVRFHFCVSRAPCGACAGPPLPQAQEHEQSGSLGGSATSVTRKPGRGATTLSVSCSDKLVKWSVLGVQGSILMRFLAKPIYFSTLVLVDDAVAGEDAAAARARAVAAITERPRMMDDVPIEPPFRVSPPMLVIIALAAAATNGARLRTLRAHLIEDEGDVPSGYSIALSEGVEDVCDGFTEVTIAKTGRRAGTTKRRRKRQRRDDEGGRGDGGGAGVDVVSDESFYSRKSCSQLAKVAMLARVRALETLLLRSPLSPSTRPTGTTAASRTAPRMTYATYKSTSIAYQTLWSRLREDPRSPLCGWARVAQPGGCPAKRRFEDFDIELEHVRWMTAAAQDMAQSTERGPV